MLRKASAVWQGGSKDGRGTLSAESGTFTRVPRAYSRRLENGPGTAGGRLEP